MPAPKAKTPNVQDAFLKYLEDDRFDTMPYKDLMGTLKKDGWRVTLLPKYGAVTHGGTPVDLAIDVSGPAPLGHYVFSTIHVFVPLTDHTNNMLATTTNVTFHALVAGKPLIPYMIFGRVPPTVSNADQNVRGDSGVYPEPTEASVDIDYDTPVAEPEEPVEDPTPEVAASVVKSLDPQGLPIFSDVYDIQGSSSLVVADILAAFQEAMGKVEGTDEENASDHLNSFFNRSGSAIEFVKDFGADGDISLIRNLFASRAADIEPEKARKSRRRGK